MRRTRLYSVLALASALAASAAGCGKGPPQLPPPEPPTVATLKPRMVPLNPTKEFTGRLVTKDPVKVLPQVSGKLLTREFKDGKYVEQGEKLFTIDPVLYKADVEKAKSDIAKAEADIANWKAQVARDQAEFARVKKSFDTGTGAQTDVDKALASVKVDEAQIKVSEANKLAGDSALVKAEENLKYCTIYAPTAGRVRNALVAPGALMDAYKTEMVTVYPVTPIYCLFEVDELTSLWYVDRIRGGVIADAQQIGVTIKLKNEKDFSTNAADRTRNSTISFPDLVIERGTGTRTIRAEFENPAPPAGKDGDRPPPALSDGSSVRVRVSAGPQRPVLAVPEAVIFSQQRKQYVYVVVDGKAQLREVEPGAAFDGMVEVNRRAAPDAPSGLTESDVVVADNLLRVRPGIPVTAK